MVNDNCNKFNVNALNNVLKSLMVVFEEDAKTCEEYINSNRKTYEASEQLGKNGWVTPFCLDNCFASYDCDADKLAKMI